ncbi:MAG: cysteine synthase [Aeromicrobium sp.]|nr:cysteine synthase [Aeromicrobium sp.]
MIEASSGSTAVSEAFFARLIGLPFVAVMPASTSPEKIALIEFYGGRCHLVDDPATMYDEARRLEAECGGHYMDQFTYAERATDWRGNNNIAESIFEQMQAEPHPCPSWVVVGAGTGGTSATIGRFVRYRRFNTRVAVADPENSAFYGGWDTDSSDVVTDTPSRIEGIGRMRVEPSFVGGVIDDMVRVPDAASIAAMRWVSRILGRPVGGSTGTNVWGSLTLIEQMRANGESGSVVTLLCDGGDRYLDTYFNDEWLVSKGLDITPYSEKLEEFGRTGVFAG